MHKNLAKWLPNRICKESVAITLSTTGDVAIGDRAIGDLTIESLDVRVAIIVVKMMSKMVATSGFSNVDSSILILVAILHRMVLCLILSFFDKNKEFCRPCSCRRRARIFEEGPKSVLSFIGPA